MRAVWISLVLGRGFWQEFSLLRRAEHSAEVLHATRQARLREVLARAGYAGGGTTPAEVLRKVPPGQRSRPRGGGGVVRRRTSGSSGAAAEVAVGRRGYAQLLAGFWRALGWWGVEPGEPGVVLLGAQGGRARLSLLRFKDRALGARRVFVGEGQRWLQQARTLLARHPFAYVYGYPSALYELARAGFALPRPPKVVLVTGEPLFAFQRKSIEAAFGARVAEEFGCTEVGAVAFQCPHGSLHLVAEQVWLEGNPAASWATSLVDRPTPLLRYPLDEPVQELGPGCGCGRVLPRGVLLRRLSPAWQVFEASTAAVASHGLSPARFRACFNGSWRLRVEEPDRAWAELLRRSLEETGAEAVVEIVGQLVRGGAGKFRYLETLP